MPVDPNKQNASRDGRSSKVKWVCFGLVGILCLGFASLESGPVPSVSNRPVQRPAEGFSTSASCRSCHPGEYGSWHASFHRTMTQVASIDSVIPEIDGTVLRLDGVVYSLTMEDGGFWVSETDERAGGSGPSSKREIVMLTGSHHQQNFWLETGEQDDRTLDPFPFGWLVKDQRWVPITDTFMCPPEITVGRATGSWNTSCINCHTTQGRMRFMGGESGFDSEVTEFGISCESCHGETEVHVQKHSNPLRRYMARLDDQPDESVVNASRLDGHQSAMVCGQCHSVWAFDSLESIEAINQTGLVFRPGGEEFSGRFLVQPGSEENQAELARLHAADPSFIPNTFWSDGIVRVTGREYNGLATSPCFEGGEFSCISCHEMHPADTNVSNLSAWAVDQMAPEMTSDSACLQCHSEIGSNLSAHTFHDSASAGSRCYDCHMPYSTYGLLGAVRTHRITSPSAQESIETGRPNACNLCHLDQSLAWTADNLNQWYGKSIPEVMTRDDRELSSGAVWMLKGDAAQRALVAWAMGQRNSQVASGSAWMAPYLAITLDDPYSAVRYIAAEALRSIPGYGSLEFDYIASPEETYAAALQAFERARELVQESEEGTPPKRVLIEENGGFEPTSYERLLDQRDQRRVYLVE